MVRCTIVVPMEADNYCEAIESAHEAACKTGGGFTNYIGNGGWKNPDGNVEQEPVTVVEWFTDENVRFMEGWVEESCWLVREITGETAVLGTVNNQKLIVED